MTQFLPHSSYVSLDQLAEDLFKILNGHIIVGTPIGIGKPNALINALYRIAKQQPEYQLDILTALSLSVPQTKNELERRLLQPFFDRHFEGVIDPDYSKDAIRNCLPSNIRLVEFYFKPGEMLGSPSAQQTYMPSNYTHVARDMMARDVNLILQMVSIRDQHGKKGYSLSANPDVTLDLARMFREKSAADGQTRLIIGLANEKLPFMLNDAEVDADFFDYIHEDSAHYSNLFATPAQPITAADHMIGLYTSTLVQDGGTLQIGIGSLGDAVVNWLLRRHQQNDNYRQILGQTNATNFSVISKEGELSIFKEGLYGNTEMLVPGYLTLKESGILNRRVFDNVSIQQLINQGMVADQPTMEWLDALCQVGEISKQLNDADLNYLQHWGLLKPDLQFENGQLSDKESCCQADLSNTESRDWISRKGLGHQFNHARLIHAGFFVGGHDFYKKLHDMPEGERQEINMTSVTYTNDLHRQEDLKIAQRQKSRFINACMMTTLTGAAISDGLADGRAVSGVGGQYNFVAMAHELPEARSILMMKAVRGSGDKAVSNIVMNYGHITIPRHLRDILITEYGIADLRGKTDAEIIDALLCITDSRFQQDLIQHAKKAGKLAADYQLPAWAQNNTPAAIAKLAKTDPDSFTMFPFGCDLTAQELKLAAALKRVAAKSSSKLALLRAIISPQSAASEKQNADLKRMGLDKPEGIKEKFYRRLLLGEL